MKKTVGLLSLLLAFLTGCNAVVPILSDSVRNAFSAPAQVASVNQAIGDNAAPDAARSEKKEPAVKKVAYDDGKIQIYNYTQLSLIGSGKSYTYEDGVSATYTPGASYQIAKDIAIPRHTLWQLPGGFKGTISGKQQPDQRLYDASTDAIYLYHVYQLAAMSETDRADTKVMSGDAQEKTFGTGKALTAGTGSKVTLTYSDDHNYVVSSQFGADFTPKALAARKKADLEPVGAAPWNGTSVYDETDGVIYIANYQQLSAIGTDAEVKSTDTNAATFGQGEVIHLSGDGTDGNPYVNVKYSKDAVYFLTTDIPLPSRTAWRVPEGFTGMFTSAAANGEDNSVLRTTDTRLYNSGSSSIYYHNVYQMAENIATLVHSTDYDALSYGDGSVVNALVYYNNARNYILASSFTAKTEFDVTEYTPATDENGNSVNAVVIRNYNQLKLVGLGESVLKTDTVNGITRTQKVRYPPNAVYYLANDIELADDGWQLPADFSGSFTCDPSNKEADSTRLYVRHTASVSRADVYIQNIYQLENLGLANNVRSEEPVLDKDYDAAQVGAGSPIYLTNVSTDYLTYGTGNTYILSRTFSNKRVDQISTTALGQIANANHIDGRDFFGQTTVEIGGDTYILIGDRQQLDAIGTDKYVYDPVYAVTQTRNSILDTWTIDESRVSLVYPGDADLIADIKTTPDGSSVQDFSTSPLFSTSAYHSLGSQRVSTYERVVYCASDGKGGYNLRGTSANANRGSQRYTKTAKYIVFRDINMNKTDKQDLHWTPLMFSGNMYGVKAESQDDVATLWDNGKTQLLMDAERKPAISNVNVNQTGKIKVNNQMGVGFFATVTNQMNAENIGITGEKAIVKNIELHDVHVENHSTEAEVDLTLLNTVTNNLGSLLGGVVDVLLRALSFGSANTDLRTTLSNLLNARAQDPSVFATGAFAGRIYGDAVVEDCCVTGNVEVSNVKGHTGGFVGYTEGVTEYSGLSQVLGGVSDVLATVLNVIPGVGLGDLITILLGNALPLDSLIPTDYISPVLKNCYAEGLTGTVGSADTTYIGGFVGQQIGTRIEGCSVKNSTYSVQAKDYGGGFAGITRDAAIKGTLDGLGIDLSSVVSRIHPQSQLIDCKIDNCAYNVTGESRLGGFVGAMASSNAVDCSIDCAGQAVTVSGTGNFVGGFAGYATVGWQANLGKDENDENSLLGTVRQLVTGLLSSDKSTGQKLLTLMGVAPSSVIGCRIYTDELTVHSGGSFAGGFVGKGDGLYIGTSDQQAYDRLADWNSGTIKDTPEDKSVILSGLKSVDAADGYAGGIAGFMSSAAFDGLLNDVVGLGDFIGFIAKDITVNGVDGGYTVSAGDEDAGGGFGLAVGGTITNVQLNELKQVQANNRAGGFVGISGPGELVGTGGLTVNLLGLDHVLEVNNLLKIGQGLEVKITDSAVTGIAAGYTVEATGTVSNESDITHFKASGFIADSNSTQILNSHAYQLKSVTAANRQGYAGGFVGTSTTGGLAETAGRDETVVSSLIQADGLLGAIKYLIPSYTDCTVNYVDGGYTQADIAGGFVADMESGTVDNAVSKVNLTDKNDADMTEADWTNIDISPWTKLTKELYDSDAVHPTGDINKQFAVFNIDRVAARTYGGGFGGRLRSGALADAGGGVSILGNSDLGVNLNINDLVNVLNSYVPIVRNAGVYSENGFTVAANEIRADDPSSGSAGGFAGYTSGAQISHCDVYRLKNTQVTPPADLEAAEAPSYFDSTQSTYAVTGGHFAGGYVGNMDIGSAASLGSGLKVLGGSVALTNVLSALDVVVTTIEHSDVQGAGGGFSVLANGNDSDNGRVGMAGGYAGGIFGGHIQNAHCKNFYYIIGQEAAGGYVGNMTPGNVAKLLDDASILNSLIDVDSELAKLVQDFVPTIRNSTTACVPCGGAVRAQAASDASHQRGCAGGFCGHNEGGHIWGLNTKTWKDQNDGQVGNQNLGRNTVGNYVGEQHICTAWRIRSVYGYEYAGGFTGYMESADTADTGNIKLLGGLIKANNILTALQEVYPTEEHTAVYGPLRNLDMATWNAWVTYVGKYGGYGAELAQSGTVSTQEALDSKLSKYIYGFNVVAGRSVHETMLITEGGNAGGYVGYMVTGVITDGQSHDVKKIRAMRSAGGYAGKMQTGAAASFGNVGILGLNLNLRQLVQAAQVFVPTIKSSSVHGWQSGMTVECFGTDFVNSCGYAGGYAGSAYGAQIWGDENAKGYTPTGCNVSNLRFVKGNNAAGGYVGMATAASVADVNTHASEGFLQGVLNSLISTPGSLTSVMEATVTTIRQAEVNPDNQSFGFTVGGASVTPQYAGGFAGTLEAAVIGSRKGESNIAVNGLRSVDGLYYAGGFVGLADVGSVGSVSSTGTGATTILNLIKAGNVDLLDIFRTYIYYSDVNGVPEGIVIRAYQSAQEGILSEKRESGCAGGFGGGVMNGSVKHSGVTGLNTVFAPNYAGGFIGHMGKNGAVDVDDAQVAGPLAGLTAGALDVFGTVVDECGVTGIDAGAIILSDEGVEAISGGFAGYADVSQIKNSNVNKLKQVYSDQIAGGFVGKTNMNYLVSAEVDSALVQQVLGIVNALIRILQVDDLEKLDLLNLDLGILGLKLLTDGDVLYVNLLGLRIGVSLVKQGDGKTGTAVITIGDSIVELPYNENGIDTNAENAEIVVNLIKGNRTRVDHCSVTGITDGYDVYGGGASNTVDGSDANGYAGGFVGYNNEGKFTSDTMVYCDVIRGTAQKVGTFSGGTRLQSVYSFNTLESIEKVAGEENHYSVYRNTDLTYALTAGNQQIGSQAATDDGTGYKRFDITHLAAPITPGTNEQYYQIFEKWNGAKLASAASGDNARLLNVYSSSAKAVLMLDTPTKVNDESLIPNPGESKDPCGNIDLTIQKIWNDRNNLRQLRPEEIQVRIWQHWENEDGTAVTEGGADKVVLYTDTAVIPDVNTTDGWFTISKADHGRSGSATWTRVIKGLPVYTTESDTTYYFSYTVEESPNEVYDSAVTYDETGSTATATIVNTPKPFEVQFKYYDRYEIDGKPSGIKDEETVYSVSIEAIPDKFITYDASHAIQYIDFGSFIGDKAVEFSKNTLGVTNVMCNYSLWTGQRAATMDMRTRTYFENGNPVRYGDNTTYHTDYLGRPYNHPDYAGQAASKNEKWVNYYDFGGNELAERFATPAECLKVNKIVVWCYNYPRQYTVNIYGANSEDDLVQKTVGGNTVFVANAKSADNDVKRLNARFYYNQRFGGENGNSDQDAGGFIENYGLSRVTNIMPEDYASESFGDYRFAYWAYDQEGTQIASVEREFWYRVTNNTKLYAVYAINGSSKPGISISANANDTFVDANGESRTRLNILGSVYGTLEYDSYVQKLSFVNISLSTQIRDNPDVYTPEKINALFEQYKEQLNNIVKRYDETYGSKSFSSAETYDGAIDENGVNTELQLTLTTKGYIYTVVSNGNTPQSGDSTVRLSNKNRVQFTTVYKTSALNINQTGTNGNTCLMYCAALKYGGEWSISSNCLIYYNGEVVDNTANRWD